MDEASQVEHSGHPADGDGSIEPGRDSPGLSEDLALARLKDSEVTKESIEEIAHDSAAMKSRKVRLALATHARTPRRIALRVIRELYTFELMQFALLPVAPADLKRIADELLIGRLASITLGERIALARRCSGVVAGGLLLDKESRVWQTALENPRLTEIGVIRALAKTRGSRAFVEAVCYHAKWSVRIEVRYALLRSAYTPLTKAIEFARRIPPPQLRDILHVSKLPESVKRVLRKEIQES
ncbi:MAG TPA: hypothetical protein VMP68_16460 [Candidatus Eisenbacteria bacterium]|nr:hypothetical protein [Candidatus Eisenbacteria bacterium]